MSIVKVTQNVEKVRGYFITAVPGATVRITKRNSGPTNGDPATHYTDDEGNNPSTDWLTADASGLVNTYLDEGDYNWIARAPGSVEDIGPFTFTVLNQASAGSGGHIRFVSGQTPGSPVPFSYPAFSDFSGGQDGEYVFQVRVNLKSVAGSTATVNVHISGGGDFLNPAPKIVVPAGEEVTLAFSFYLGGLATSDSIDLVADEISGSGDTTVEGFEVSALKGTTS